MVDVFALTPDDSGTLLDWGASTPMRDNEVRRHPDTGQILVRIKAGTSRPALDATELALFKPAGGGGTAATAATYITVASGRPYFDPDATSPPAAVTVTNGRPYVETGA